ncbi:MAG: hypothetical protein KTR24_13845 [Saprospiraceae bacterium]|nr:hypothetical protein [Saprospiraceae bacterium]
MIDLSGQYALVERSTEILDLMPPCDITELNGYTLYSRCRLEVSTEASKTIVLLGDAIDFQNPLRSNEEILALGINEKNIFEYFKFVGGNYVVIIIEVDSILIFHDAGGVFKVFYTTQGGRKVVASDPRIIRHFTKCSVDPQGFEFYSHSRFQQKHIRLGNRTKYDNVRQLLPNHALNLSRLTTSRFYPLREIARLSVTDAKQHVRGLMENAVEGFGSRYKLACSITAGFDSRVVLAATRKMTEDIRYYTWTRKDPPEKDIDVAVAKKIALDHNLRYEIFSSPHFITKEYEEALTRRFEILDLTVTTKMLHVYQKLKAQKIALLVGFVSEVCKNYYGAFNITGPLDLAKAAHMPLVPYVVEYVEESYKGLSSASQASGIDIRDLAHWEQDITNFAAQRSFYISAEVNCFSLFNCRGLLEIILGTERQLRDKYNHPFYRALIKELWNGLEQYPINPDRKTTAIRIAKRLRLYDPYKRWSTSRGQ